MQRHKPNAGNRYLRPNRVRLYRFLVISGENNGARGEPFAMCDRCKETYEIPAHAWMEKIANEAVWECQQVNHVQDEKPA